MTAKYYEILLADVQEILPWREITVPNNHIPSKLMQMESWGSFFKLKNLKHKHKVCWKFCGPRTLVEPLFIGSAEIRAKVFVENLEKV